jgi:hypothetical protein
MPFAAPAMSSLRGMSVADVGNVVPRVHRALDEHGWLPMMVDHRQAVMNIIREFYANNYILYNN